MDSQELKSICEALIFASDIPLKIGRICEISGRPENEVRDSLDILEQDLLNTGRAFQMVKVAGGYQLVTRAPFAEWIRKLSQERRKSRLSQSALETLSIIAYKQPIGRTEVDTIRGVDSSGTLKTLLERGLIDILSRGKGPGRPNLYKTTDEFLRYFGLVSLDDLPKLKEIEEILAPESYEAQQISGDDGGGVPQEE